VLPLPLRYIEPDPDVVAALDASIGSVNEIGFDAWGFSPEWAKVLYTIGKRVYDYFRPEVFGAENIPAGRVLIVPNHAGQLPFDGIVIAVATLLHTKPPRLCRAMVERWFPKTPFINEIFARGGAVLGAPINCRNLLLDDQAILVFPEGARGSGKLFQDRYKLVDFGRGFMRLALQTKTPIVPTAVIGSEESIVSVHSSKLLARVFQAPYFPIPPHLPLLGALAYFPLPVKFRVHFGKPMYFEGAFDDEDSAIDAKVAEVQAEVQRMIDAGLKQRGDEIF
jgi:1-acyl-sn-glycerol-3-phosphate acyltransferase